MGALYCTTDQVRAFNQDPEMDLNTLGILIDAVSRAIDRWCRRRFYVENAARVYDYVRDQEIRLRDDLMALTSITTNAGQTFGPSDVILYPRYGPPYRYIRFPRNSGDRFRWTGTPDGAITVTGDWGNADPGALSMIKMAAILWVSDLYATADARGLSGVSGDTVSATLAQRLETPPADALPFLRPLRRHRLLAVG